MFSNTAYLSFAKKLQTIMNKYIYYIYHYNFYDCADCGAGQS